MGIAECRPIMLWKPIHGDVIISSRTFSSWFGLIVDINGADETVDIIYAASPRILFGLSPTEQKKRKKTLDISAIKDSTSLAVQQNLGGKTIWYLQ